MATADVSSRDAFTYLWIIENVFEWNYINTESPLFVERSISAKALYLQILETPAFCFFLRSDDDLLQREACELDIEVSILAADGSTLISDRNNGSELFVLLLTREAFLERREEFVWNNSLTIQCRIRRRGNDILTGFCYAESKLDIYRTSFLWTVEEFSSLPSSTIQDLSQLTEDEKKVYPMEGIMAGRSNSLILYLKQNSQSEDVYVDFLFDGRSNYAYSYEISLLDANGKTTISKSERGRLSDAFNFQPFVSKSQLMSNRNLFLRNDSLLLKCSFEICYGCINVRSEYCRYWYTSNVADVAAYVGLRCSDDPMNSENAYHFCKDSCSLKATLEDLHNGPTFSDISLRVGTKLFPAHKNILCSRSDFFSKLLRDNLMKKTIDIEDISEITLSHLLQYIYTDAVGDLEYADALDLYKAAADYQFLDLRNKCSDILISYLRWNNVQEILSLAKKYQDKKLKEEAEEIEWRYLDNPFYDDDFSTDKDFDTDSFDFDEMMYDII